MHAYTWRFDCVIYIIMEKFEETYIIMGVTWVWHRVSYR